MHLDVTPRKHRGRTLSQKDLQAATPVRGDLISWGASPRWVAKFQLSAAAAKQPLPPLCDAGLSWMGTNGFVLGGIEIVDGTAYGQSWLCRPVA